MTSKTSLALVVSIAAVAGLAFPTVSSAAARRTIRGNAKANTLSGRYSTGPERDSCAREPNERCR